MRKTKKKLVFVPVDRRPSVKKRAKFEREYGSAERVAFVASLPCIASSDECMAPIENAHTETGGMGRKGPASSIVPACCYHHHILHTWGVMTFQAKYRVDLAACAAETAAAWDKSQEGM
jgi:hypothetical protein